MGIPDELSEMIHGHGGLPDYPAPPRTSPADFNARSDGVRDRLQKFVDSGELVQEAEPPARFRFELNVGTGNRDILDSQNENVYLPIEGGDAEATELCVLLNKFHNLADSFGEWSRDRKTPVEQAEQAILAIRNKATYLDVPESDPTKPLRELAQMLRNRGIR